MAKALEVEQIAISSLHEDPANARKHGDKNLAAIKGSLARFGQQKPIVVNSKNIVIAGNGTLAAAKALGWDKINIVRSELEGTEATAFAIADNRTGELAAWEDDVLAKTLQSLKDENFDLESIGFDDDDLEQWLKDAVKLEPGCDEDEVPEKVEPKTKPGDLYQLGNHRLLCGDSTNVQHVERLMNGEKADMVHTDPPYNVNYSNQDRPKAGKRDLGRIENDQMEDKEFLQFLTDALALSFVSSGEDASIYIWYASKETLNFHAAAAAAAGWSVNQQIIWKKPMLLGRGRYQWAHEPCVFAVKGSPYFTDDRSKTTVWDFGGYDKSKNVHPTQKPVFIPEEAIGNSSRQGDTILDLFLGSGSTLIACEKTNRKCFGMELDPKYCDVIVARWEKYTGKKAELLNG